MVLSAPYLRKIRHNYGEVHAIVLFTTVGMMVLASANNLTCPQLCLGVLLRTPGLTGCIVGSRNARQGATIASLGVDISDELVAAVSAITARLRHDLGAIPA